MKYLTLSTDQSALRRALKDLGQLIRGQRIRRRLRSVDLAAAAGVSIFVLVRVEAGKPIRTDSLLKIMHALGLAMGGQSELEPVHQAENSAPLPNQQSVSEISEHALPIFYVSQIRITPRQTPEDIRRAISEGRISEMSRYMAGYDDDEK